MAPHPGRFRKLSCHLGGIIVVANMLVVALNRVLHSSPVRTERFRYVNSHLGPNILSRDLIEVPPAACD